MAHKAHQLAIILAKIPVIIPRREQNRLTRRDRYEARMEPWISALLGVAIAALFLAQKDIGAKVIYLLLFIFWTWASGKRFSLVSTVLVTLGIVAANLLIPSGRVLIKIGPLAVTQLALIEGFSKALTFEGLMYLSKAAIMPSLQLPGKFGALIAQAFQYYDRIIEYQGTNPCQDHCLTISMSCSLRYGEKSGDR